ncbi:peroxiredoxin [Winogradskyella epiphytica]|uniref:Peroxiredoxin n=1 Tax=Winogradskyella epiphytica TaxID=262005 RepID=A0A2V4XG92_9FLAO|nr:TlpA disulfide reductase family protein [Winogradskyella epiphytica]PYE80129.1 peroxiredoxin [Winogradskyella epiphytica]
MKKINIIVVLLLIFMSCKDEKKAESKNIDIGDFSFSSKDIVANKTFKITYNGNGDLDDSFFYHLINDKSYPYDLEFEDNTAIITVPDSISAVAFNFKLEDDYVNNNKKGFLFKVINEEGESAEDVEASKDIYKVRYGDRFGLEGDAESALSTLESVLEEHPNLKKDWMESHLILARQVGAPKVKEVANAYLSDFSDRKAETLEDFKSLSAIYSSLRDTNRNDSIKKLVSEKYPESELAVSSIIDDFFATKDLNTKEKIFNEHKERLLKSKNAKFVLRSLAQGYYNKGDQDNFETYVNLMDSNMDEASLYNSIAWPLAEKGENLEEAALLSKKSLDLIKEEQQSPKEQPDYLTPKQYHSNLERTYNMYADTYALLSFKKGDIKEAIKYQALAVDEGKDAEVNERYIQFLMEDEQFETAMEKASEFIEDGNSSAKLKAYFKEAVTKADPNKNVDALLANLEEKAKAKELEKLKKSMLDDEATDFTLKNLDGNEVTLSSLKGKTVILDFWATWCGPCKASFPGMQEVVTKYKDDDKVEFLFIDTFEDGKDRLDKVSKFIKDNNYTFNVLVDPKNEESGQFEVANKYKVSGIPTKVIIGPSGKVNFISVGYSGSTEKVVSEIDAMVEILSQS